MVKAIKSNNISQISKQMNVSPNEIVKFMSKEINDFIYVESTTFFSRFGVGTNFNFRAISINLE